MGIFTLLGIACICGAVTVHSADETGIKVTPQTSTVFIKKGGRFMLTCESSRNDISLTWKVPPGFSPNEGFAKNSMVVYNTDQEPKSIKGMKAELEIANHETPGTYICKAEKGEEGNKVEVESYPLEFYTVTEEVQEAVFDKDIDSVTLSCKISVEGVEIKEPVWKKNETDVKDVVTDGSKLEPDMENLIISGVMRSDAAMYTAEYTLEVNGVSDKYKCNVPLKAGPLVLDFDKSKNLIEDENLELNCKILGYPAPMVKWMKDGNDLESNPRITMQDYNGVKNATLKVKNVVFDDAGDYSCFASSEELNSTNSKSITVRVKDRYAALWPFIGIVGEVIVLCTFIFIYEKRRSRQAEQEDAGQDEAEPVQKSNVRNRRNQK